MGGLARVAAAGVTACTPKHKTAPHGRMVLPATRSMGTRSLGERVRSFKTGYDQKRRRAPSFQAQDWVPPPVGSEYVASAKPPTVRVNQVCTSAP